MISYVLLKMRSPRWLVLLLLFCYTILMLSSLHCCCANDTITIKASLVDGETLVSAANRFELGFFSPSGSSNVKRYVGIWYVFDSKTVVWVANRENPLPDKSGVLHIEDGYLKLSDKKEQLYWSPLPRSRLSLSLKLNDNGNLILYDKQGRNLWQSFEHPTDTFLFGMNMDENLVLKSWTSLEDPAPGNFVFKQDQENRLVVMNKSSIYWKSWRESGKILELLDNLNITGDDNTQVHINERMLMSFTGELQYWKFDTDMKNWSLMWREPKDKCSKYNYCGFFGTCNINNKLPCKCLPGFEPKHLEKWTAGDFGDGCSRNSTSYDTYFLSLKRMKLEYPESSSYGVDDEKSCREECLSNSQCQAYSLNASDSDRKLSCLIWTDDLKNIQEDQDDGYGLYVRLLMSNIESTYRNCETCGTNLVPYPLSTQPNCGDPMYYSFHCKNDTDELSFKTPSGSYNVSSVNPESRIFVIKMKVEEAVNCNAIHLNQSSPFHVTSDCSRDVDSPLNGTIEVEISWKSPLEPTCKSSTDCRDWPHSTCNKTGNGKRCCLCDTTFRWDGSALNCTQVVQQSKESFNKRKRKTFPLFLVVSLPIVMTFLCTIVSIYLWRKKVVNKRAKKMKARLHRYDTERGVKELMESTHMEGKDGTGIDVPFFDFASILAATDNFSDENKLGKGGFGPVYKGKFPGGQDIAIKRLASASGQGLDEFKNEVVLIAKLQHRNLVRLLGYCISGEERILLYEYMPNKSLDYFIFEKPKRICIGYALIYMLWSSMRNFKDESFSQQLDWEMRFNIILGTARGLLYLHQDSRLRIIHRDMKTSNILLDEEMNPKISDFGLARMIQGKQTEGTTLRVVGTYGYMAPEYALDGLFSVKSDVFSFGVVMFEIISGKKNLRFYHVENTPSLIAYAWRLWQECNALDLVDETVRSSCNASEVLRCVQVGLLCVQEDPSERPTMSNIVVLLGSETANLPIPKQPAFVTRATLSATASTSSKAETNTEITATCEEGR